MGEHLFYTQNDSVRFREELPNIRIVTAKLGEPQKTILTEIRVFTAIKIAWQNAKKENPVYLHYKSTDIFKKRNNIMGEILLTILIVGVVVGVIVYLTHNEKDDGDNTPSTSA